MCQEAQAECSAGLDGGRMACARRTSLQMMVSIEKLWLL